MSNSSTLNFLYDLNDDVIDELSDYLGKDTCYQLTRAFPLLLTNLNLQWKSNEYITANPYKSDYLGKDTCYQLTRVFSNNNINNNNNNNNISGFIRFAC